MMRFLQPVFMVLLPVIVLVVWRRSRRKLSGVRYASLADFKEVRALGRIRWMWILPTMRFLALLCIVLGLARPQGMSSDYDVETEGIDIVLALDISGSMLAEDFKPQNRLMVSLDEAKKFIAARPHDRIGLVVFASQAYTQCPLTLDHDVLLNLLDEVKVGLVKDGTAIGLGIATAINRLKDSEGKSKVVILLTDGENNAGNIDPITAAEIARGFGIKIYTIGVGQGGLVPFPVDDPIFGRRYVQARVDIDEETLKRIADIGGGIFFRAYDQTSLSKTYQQIDLLERTKTKVTQYSDFRELYPWFVYPGLGLFVLELLLANTLFVKIP
ncbi:MAG: VWA domain-containing protein [Candidatus Omnitrophica bacterium]|nr:VWA domain-containing protein [Candidatus Omnitrophota bacterium]